MANHDSQHCREKAAAARGAADHKNGGRSARVAGHLALAYDALARIKARREAEAKLPRTKH